MSETIVEQETVRDTSFFTSIIDDDALFFTFQRKSSLCIICHMFESHLQSYPSLTSVDKLNYVDYYEFIGLDCYFFTSLH